MSDVAPIDLGAARRTVICEPGDDVVIPITARGQDTTDWELEFSVYQSNRCGDGPTGASVGGSVANSPNSPDSGFTLSIDHTVTAANSQLALWGVLTGTIDGARRTLIELMIQVQ